MVIFANRENALMMEFFYLDADGRELGSTISYHSLTKFRPRVRKARTRRIDKRRGLEQLWT
ncbi:hypothetical protein [Sinorhizobium meliloti]|uniref:Uncharacterized protein n=1 Tax=Rhizobium meliloti (strain 1021) TaxID=266834 RepID=Q92LD1_RHIME|nr:hypothetical protein [Sinorhizobium meliloti]AGG75731.1 Hypothetical protein SM2011_c03289 [Sinorhizobium meliloti 2011]TWA91509.1 hypothetical protein FB000_13087 [Ensifer sp. SEMIA 134]TWB28005.1 hypothetical protein FB001_1285 [Ensifer sp. SEMIA 135]ASP58472.1 hypothetical protein CDO30_09235 [Sinorhizobium meliloti]MCK3802118.1 hypothetical protein [Sinorhizobium meliloti]